MKLPSFSKLELADLCQYPWTSGIKHSYTESDAALFGKAVHKMAECVAVWGDAPVGDIADAHGLHQDKHEALINAYVELTDQLNHEAKLDHWRETELCFGLQLHTGLVRRLEFERRWRRRPNEVVGIIDLVREDEDGRLRVRDYKTGYGSRFMRPLESLQLLCYGLAATRLFKRERVIVELCQIESDIHLESGEMDEFLLDWTWERLHSIESKAMGQANNVPKPGPHCRELFCPILDKCEATQASVQAIAASSALAMPLVADIQSDEHARYIYERLPAVKAALKQVEEALKSRCQAHPLFLDDDRVLANWETTRETVAVNDAALSLLNKYLDDKADDLVERKISNTALKALCKEIAPSRGATKLYKLVWDELEKVGAVHKITFTKFEARKRKASQ